MNNWKNGQKKVTDEQLIEMYNKLGKVQYTIYQTYLKENLNLEIHPSSILKRFKTLRKKGLIPLESGVSVESTTILKGISRYHKLEDGGVWVKSDVEKENLLNNIQEGIKNFYEDYDTKYEFIEVPKTYEEDLLTFYPLPDMHWGLLTHGEELQHNEDFNLEIQEQWVLGAMKYLVDTALPTKQCVITDLGDLLHAMDDRKQTKSGHNLDVAGRTHKIVKVMFSAFTKLVDMALKKHDEVIIYSIAGNHSDLAGLYLKAHLSSWYRNEPRVVIIESEKSQQYMQFGKCILGFTHGHELKPQNAGEVLIADNMSIISETEHRYYHFGHFHKNQIDKSYSLCNVEIHCNNLPRDKWADSQGFRGKIGEAKAITYHKKYGEISRNRFNINMLENKKENNAKSKIYSGGIR